jgi:sugar lactone lactonase YvrE
LKEFENPTSVAFGGKDYRYLFITSGENLIGRKAGGFNGGIAII